jgi:hypothetical protein
MMRIDIQAEHILSIQNEKREKHLHEKVYPRDFVKAQPSLANRLLDATGKTLILTGQKLQQLAGNQRAAEQECSVLGEAI